MIGRLLALAVALVGAACSGGEPEAAVRLCDALGVELLPDDDSASAASVADVLASVPADGLLGFDAIVYFRPDAAARSVDAVVAAIESTDGVVATLFLDQEAAYAEFVLLFAGAPDFVEGVSPADLPASLKVGTGAGEDPRSVLREFGGEEAVQEIIYAGPSVGLVAVLVDADLVDQRDWLDDAAGAAEREDHDDIAVLADVLDAVIEGGDEHRPFTADDFDAWVSGAADLVDVADDCGLAVPSPTNVLLRD